MPTTLVTFLGRVPKLADGYRTTRYRFDDGQQSEPVAFFGWPLVERIKPDNLVVLGTKGSMWDHLVEQQFELGRELEDERLNLSMAVENSEVDSSMLEALQPHLSDRLGCHVKLQLIPYCHEQDEQVELLQILSENVNDGEVLHIDVTHAFRHIPMISLLGAMYLGSIKRSKIDHIWYGAYDEVAREGTVVDLVGMLKISEWVTALSSYDKDGDYSVFVPLLPEKLGNLLAEASFFESANRIGQARSKGRAALELMESEHPQDAAMALFQPALRSRLSWVKGNNSFDRQRMLAYQALERWQYLDSVILAYEAFITKLALQGSLQPDQPKDRERAREDFDEREKNNKPRSKKYNSWDTLRRLRNAMVHGGSAKGEEVQKALGQRSEMDKLLRSVYEILFGSES